MHQPLKFLSFVTATLLLSLASPLALAATTLETSSTLAQAPTPQDNKATTNVEGAWNITEAKTLDGRNYTGTVAIQPIGQIYAISWKTSAGNQSGIAFLEDGHLLAGWGTDEAAGYGVVVYKIGKDGTLDGKWTYSKQGGEIGTETATGGKPDQIEGDYQVSGTNPHETARYKGTLNIRKTGDTYQLTWAVGTSYRGVGIRSGNWLVVSWGQSEQLGVVDYAISGDKASGRSARFNQSSLSVENLVHSQATANLSLSCTPAQTPTTQNRKAQADCFLEQGIKQIDTKRYQVALQSLQQALAIYREIQDRQGEGQTLKNLGNAYYGLKDYIKAREYQQQALAIARDIHDRDLEARALLNMGAAYKELGESAKAIDYYQQSLLVAQEIQSRDGEWKALNNLSIVYTSLKDYTKAIEYQQKVLAIAKVLQDRNLEWTALSALVSSYNSLKDYQKVIEFAQASLTLAQETQNHERERLALKTLVSAYTSLRNHSQAIEYQQKLLVLTRELKDRQSEGKILLEIGLAYDNLKNYQQAIASYQQSLAIAQEISDRATESRSLNNLGWVYHQRGDYNQAIDYYQRSLAIAKAIPNRQMQVKVLTNLGNAYSASGNYSKTIEYRQQLLAIARETKDHQREGNLLLDIGLAYDNLKNYQQAIASYQQSLAIAQEISDRMTEGWSLNNLGWVYQQQENYNQAIDYYQRSLAIAQAIPDRQMQVKVLTNLINAHNLLGDSHKGFELAQQSLAFARKIQNRELESAALIALSSGYFSLRDYQKSIEYSQQVLAIHRELKERNSELLALHMLGANYFSLGDYQKLIELTQQELELARKIKNYDYEGGALANMSFGYYAQGDPKKTIELGQQALAVGRENKSPNAEFGGLVALSVGYANLGNNEKALEFAQESLAIARDRNHRGRVADNAESLALNIMGSLYRKVGRNNQAITAYRESLAIDESGFNAQVGLARIYRELNMPITAITYYKQAISSVEQIRGKITGLDQQLQKSFLQAATVDLDRTRNADIYRELADLLLSQGRILEAQQALELLKVQEIREFTRDRRAGGKNSEVALNQTEEQIKKENGTLIAFGQRLYECQQTRCSQLSQLLDQRETLTEQFNQKIQSIEKDVRDRRAKDDAFFDPTKLAKAREIVEAQPGTVLIYPFILEDKIWLLWTSKGGVVKSVEVPVGRSQLEKTVFNFRQLLQNPSSDITQVKATSKQLYDWLIKPIEPELLANKIQNLVFSLDRAARYIPMSALFDGEKYLIENYAVSTVLSADLTNTSDRLPLGTQNTSVLALGLSNAVAGFNPLPNVPAELEAIVRKKPNDTKGIYPGLEFLNSAFDFRALRDNLLGHQLLHIATHGEFVPGSPDSSYLLLGTGEKLAIPQIATLQDLGKVQLVVLSACQTALAERGQDGNEINGISYYFLNGGAKAVMASLWSVNDDSTRLLMQNFYGNLAKGTSTTPITKAQALQQAQLNLLHGQSSTTPNPDQRASLAPEARPVSQTASTNSTTSSFSHPYYWAPFILIGNSL